MNQLPLLLVEVTVVFAVALLGARLASRARAAVRHLILASAFSVALILPLATLVSPTITVEIAALPARAAVPVTAYPAILPAALPNAAERSAVEANPAAATPLAPSPTSPMQVTTWLLLAWAVVASIALLPVGASLSHLRSIRRRGRRWPEGAARLEQVMPAAATRCPVVLLDDVVSAPITAGLARPVIALPADAVTWSDTHLTNALLHELEHVRRRDWIVHLAARTVCALYWFHPLAWMTWRAMRLEAERACDDAVLAREDAAAYAEQLLELARRMAGMHGMPGMHMVSTSNLSSRIRAVLDSKLPRGRVGGIALACVVIAAIVAIAMLAPLRATGPASAAVAPVADSNPSASPAPAPQPAATSPESSFPYDSRVGLVSLRDQGGCLSIFNPAIAAGTKLTLVRPRSSDPAAVVQATVGERQAEKCPASLDRQQDRGLDPSYYRIEMSGSKPSNGQVFAILDPPGFIVLRDGRIEADIEGDGLRESFGTCSSTENVHYVVWTELPAQRLKRWHGNIYYAYDMEVSCIDDDVLVPPEKAGAAINTTPASAALPMGRYLAVTESEWNIELNLDGDGGATYTISSWATGRAAPAYRSDIVKGRWAVNADVLTMSFGGEHAGKTVVYRITPCLSYRFFGAQDCSMGLEVVTNTMSSAFSQPLWSAGTFKTSTNAPAAAPAEATAGSSMIALLQRIPSRIGQLALGPVQQRKNDWNAYYTWRNPEPATTGGGAVAVRVQSHDSAEAAQQGFDMNVTVTAISPSRREDFRGAPLLVWDQQPGQLRFLFRVGNDVVNVSGLDSTVSRDFLMKVAEAVTDELIAAGK